MHGLHVNRQATGPPPPPLSPRRAVWPWLAGVAGLAILVVTGFWALAATTVSNDAYDDAVAARDAALADLAGAETSRDAAQLRVANLVAESEAAAAQVERLTAALTAAEEEAAAATTEEEAIRARLIEAENGLREVGEAVDDVLDPVSALTLWALPLPDELPTLAEDGADEAVLEALLVELGLGDSLEAVLAGDSWGFAFFSALSASGPEVEAAWDAWLSTPAGSPEELATDLTLQWRLQLEIAERLNVALALTGRPVAALNAGGV